jgi:hypothetical protein
MRLRLGQLNDSWWLVPLMTSVNVRSQAVEAVVFG